MLSQGAVDVGLVTAAVSDAGFESSDEIRVKAQGDLSLDGAGSPVAGRESGTNGTRRVHLARGWNASGRTKGWLVEEVQSSPHRRTKPFASY